MAAPQRRVDVELLRVVSIVGVMTIHATGTSIAAGVAEGAGPSYWLALGANAFSRFSVPLFFAIAGWAQLARRPADDEGAWLRGRMSRLLVPLLIWSVIYVLSDMLRSQLREGNPLGGLEFDDWLTYRLQITAFGPGVKGHLWFIYFLIPMTFAIWLAQVPDRLRSDGGSADRWRSYGLVGVGVVAALGVVAVLRLPISWGGFIWTLGYAAIGFAILSWRPGRWRWAAIGLYVVAAGSILVLGHLIGYDTWPFYNQSPLVLLAMLGVIVAATTISEKSISEPRRAWILRLGSLTFGAYLAHFLVLDWLTQALLVVDRAVGVPGPIKLLTVLAGTAFVTFALVGVWHRSRRLTTILG